MGYREAAKEYKKRHGKLAKSSWIAQILSEHGKTSGRAHSRKGNYKYPCPPAERKNLEKLLKDLKMI